MIARVPLLISSRRGFARTSVPGGGEDPGNGGPGSGDPITMLHGVSGPISPTSHRIKFKSDADADGVRLAYSTDPTLQTGVQYTDPQDLSAANYHTFDVTLTGLQPDTEYFWAPFAGGELAKFQGHYGRFRTAPAGPKTFTFAFGSCNQYSGGQPRDLTVWDHIRLEEPDFICHLDDFHYADIAEAGRLADRIAADEQQLGMPRQGACYMRVPLVRSMGDHDFCGNDSWGGPPDGGAPGKADALAAFKITMPHAPLEDPDGGIYWAWTWGRVRFLKLDGRFYRHSRWQSGSSKSMLGTVQKAWFKSEIDNAAAGLAAGTIGLVVVLGDVPWTGAVDSDDDAWMGYASERAELAEYIEQAGMTQNLYWIHGDMHRMAYDDGTNSRFSSTNSGQPAFPVACGSSFGNAQGTIKGAYTNVESSASQNRVGFLTITDDGGDEITATLSLRAVNTSDGSQYTEPLGQFVDTFDCTVYGVLASADFEDGTYGDFSQGGSASYTADAIVVDPTGSGRGNVVQLDYLAGTGSDVDNYLAWNPSPSNPIGAGDTIYCYGKFFVVDNGYTGNRKLWRYYVGPQGSNASDLTIWMSTTLRIEGPLVNQGLYYQNTGATVTLNAWHELEVQMTFDSAPGAGNGSLRVWLDRVLVHEDTGLGFINAQYPTLSVVRFGYQTQSTRDDIPDRRYWDNLTISRSRVGA